MNAVVRSVLILYLAFCVASLSAAPLTVERIFSAPNLAGPSLRAVKVSPDGRYVTYLQGKPENKDQLDLWAFDLRSGTTRALVDSNAFIEGAETLSAAEEARRERLRISGLRGIVDYEFSHDGAQLLVPIAGDLYIYSLAARGNPVRRITRTAAYEAEAHFSPRARYLSFVREQNLWCIDLQSQVEYQITHDGGGVTSNGVAEFIAQEEMDRANGYWWSPDEKHIAFARVDESPIAEVERYQIEGDGVRTVRQRYPAAGAANADVRLLAFTLESKTTRSLATLGDNYLTRVSWFSDSVHLAIQRQSRNQQQLDLIKTHVLSGATQTLITERSRTWLNIGDDPKFLAKRDQFIWTSARSGYNHLYLYDNNGHLVRPLTSGDWMVTGEGIVGVDSKRELVYFTANAAGATEQHLYSVSFNDRNSWMQRVSKEAGWHDVKLLPNASGYLDLWSSPTVPPNVAVRARDGSLRQYIARNALDAGHPYAPFLSQHVAEEFGVLRAVDGQALHYRLLKPANLEVGRRYPVVIDTYGGPGVQYVKQDFMGGSRAAQGFFRQVLAQNGFVVFTLDNRGSGARGTAFEAPIYGKLGQVELSDQLRGVEYLRSLPFVDAQRIGMMGWSYGGYMTLLALTHAPQVFKAGVAGAPVTDWRLYDTHYTERFLGMPVDNTAGYADSAVFSQLEKLQGRLFLVHGMADDNVLFAHSTRLMQELQRLNKPFDLMTYPGGKHGLIRDPVMGRHYYESVLRFFRERL